MTPRERIDAAAEKAERDCLARALAEVIGLIDNRARREISCPHCEGWGCTLQEAPWDYAAVERAPDCQECNGTGTLDILARVADILEGKP